MKHFDAFLEGFLKQAGIQEILQDQLAASKAVSAGSGPKRLLASREHVDDRLSHGLSGAASVGIPATAAGALIGAGLAMLMDGDPMAGAGLGAVLLGSSGAAVGQAAGQLKADEQALERAGLESKVPNPARFALPYPVASVLADPGHVAVTKRPLPE